MPKTFTLEIDRTVTKLSGNKLGRSIYGQQVQPTVDFKSEMTFIFPEWIDFLASSFIQGFFYEIVKEIGIDGVESRVHVISQMPNIKEVVMQSLLSKEG